MRFHESQDFFENLDGVVRRGEGIEIEFTDERLEVASRLWPRLRRCANWRDLEAGLASLEGDGNHALRSLLEPRLVDDLAARNPRLVASAAAWLGGAFGQGTYRRYRAEIRVDPATGRGRLDLRRRAAA